MTRRYYSVSTIMGTGVHAQVDSSGFNILTSLTDPGTASPVQRQVTVLGGATGQLCFAIYTPGGEPNNAAWPAGNYNTQVDVATAGADLTYGNSPIQSDHIARVNGTATADLQTNSGNGTWTGTGLKTSTITWVPSSGSASDRFESLIAAQNGSMHTDEILGINVNTSNTYLEGPWPQAATLTDRAGPHLAVRWARAPEAVSPGASSWNIPIDEDVAVGECLIIQLGWESNGTYQISSVVDSQSNSYGTGPKTIFTGSPGPGAAILSGQVATALTGGVDAVTVTMTSGPVNYVVQAIRHVKGITAFPASTGTNTGNSTAPDVACSTSTSAVRNLLIGTCSWGQPFTNYHTTTGDLAEDTEIPEGSIATAFDSAIVNYPGSSAVHDSGTLGGTSHWAAVVAAFQADGTVNPYDTVDAQVSTGTNYPRTVSDTVSIGTDAGGAVLALFAGVSETLTTSESTGRQLVLDRGATDTTSVSDSVGEIVDKLRSVSDDVSGLTEQAGRMIAFARGPPDTVTTSETVAAELVLDRSGTDTTSLTDSIVEAHGFSRSAADTTTLSDSATGALLKGRDATDTTTLSESAAASVGVQRTASETLSTSDMATPASTQDRVASDTTTLSEAIAEAQGKAVDASDTAAVSESVVALGTRMRSSTDTTALTDVAVSSEGWYRGLIETLSGSDAAVAEQVLGRSASDTTSLSEIAAVLTGKARAANDATSLSDSVGTQSAQARGASDSPSLNEVVTAQISGQRVVDDTTTLSESPSVQIGRNSAASDVTSLSDSVGAQSDRVRAVAEMLSVSEVVAGGVGVTRTVGDTTALSETATRDALVLDRSSMDTLTTSDVIDSVALGPPVDVVPVSDTSTTGWTGEDGRSTNLYPSISDASDLTWIKSPDNPSASVASFGLSTNAVDPGSDEAHQVKYTVGGQGSATITVRLKQGATLIQAWLHVNPSTATQYTQDVDPANVALITDYTALVLEVEAN